MNVLLILVGLFAIMGIVEGWIGVPSWATLNLTMACFVLLVEDRLSKN